MSAGILLARFGGLAVESRIDALYICAEHSAIQISRVDQWPEEWFDSPAALLAGLQIPYLVEAGIADEDAAILRIPYSRFPAILRERFTLPFLWSDWSPFTMSVHTTGTLAENNLRFSAGFLLGDQQIAVERAGRYVRRTGHAETWLLDDLSFALLEHLASLHTGGTSWIAFAFVKQYAAELCAEMDDYLRGNDVIFPAAIRISNGVGLRRLPRPLVDEAPAAAFRRAYDFHSTMERRLMLRMPSGACGHLVFDDVQLRQLRALKAGGELTEIPISPEEPVAGRVGLRRAIFEGEPCIVPVRIGPLDEALEEQSENSGEHTLYEQELESMRGPRLAAVVACLYASRGYQVILTPVGGGLGAAVVAIGSGEVLLVRVETGPASPASLDAMARMRAAYRRELDHLYRLVLIVRTICTRELKQRAAALNMEIIDGVCLIDEIEARPITDRDVLRAEDRRCRSPLEVVERLRALLAGNLVEESRK